MLDKEESRSFPLDGPCRNHHLSPSTVRLPSLPCIWSGVSLRLTRACSAGSPSPRWSSGSSMLLPTSDLGLLLDPATAAMGEILRVCPSLASPTVKSFDLPLGAITETGSGQKQELHGCPGGLATCALLNLSLPSRALTQVCIYPEEGGPAHNSAGSLQANNCVLRR